MFKYPLFFFLILELNPSSFLEEIHMLALPCLMTHEQVWLEGCLSFFSKHISTHYHTLSWENWEGDSELVWTIYTSSSFPVVLSCFLWILYLLSVKHWNKNEGYTSETSLVAQTVKRLPKMQGTWVQSLGWEDPLEKEMATHSSTLAWKILWMEEPGGPQSMGSQRVRHDWVTSLSFFHLYTSDAFMAQRIT